MEFAEAARALGAIPQVTIAEHARDKPAAAIVAQCPVAMRRVREHDAATPAGRFGRAALRAPEARVEPAWIETLALRQRVCIEQNRAVSSLLPNDAACARPRHDCLTRFLAVPRVPSLASLMPDIPPSPTRLPQSLCPF